MWCITLSKNVQIQDIIQKCKDIVAKEDIKAALRYIEYETIELEKNGKNIESSILWEFFAELCEKLDDDEALGYAYGKLITRYLMLNEHEKATAIYKKASEKQLYSFYLDITSSLLFTRKTKSEHLELKEIVKVEREDLFGDYEQILAAPNIPFRSLAEIKRYVEEHLPKGTYKIEVYNKNSKNFETTKLTTEMLVEYEVINIENILEV